MKNPFAGKAQFSGSTTVPSPIGGLNAINPISAMPESDAILMRNFFPEPYGVTVRKGYKEHATGLTGDVNTIMRFASVDGTVKVFAVDDVGMFDVTAPGDYSAATPLCTVTNSWWQFTNMANISGTSMIAFNGADDGILYTDTGLVRLVAGDGVTANTWKNIDPKELVSCIAHQHRLWAVEKDSTRGWYLPPEQVWGVATSFDFGGNFARGGFLQSLVTYTVDSGYGPNDYLAAISSAGEISLYLGTDPDSLATWQLIGVFYVGATFTRRCTTKYGGDFALLTQYGMVTMNSVLKPETDSVLNNALSQKIQYLMSAVITDGATGGVVNHHLPFSEHDGDQRAGDQPVAELPVGLQHLTKAWSQFDGMVATCWQVIYDTLAFGTTGKVYRAWEGSLDDVKLTTAVVRRSPRSVSRRSATSSCLAPPSTSRCSVPPSSTVASSTTRPARTWTSTSTASRHQQPSPRPTSAFWDVSKWDSTAKWAGGNQSDKKWVSIVGYGYAAAIRITVRTSSDLTWVSTDWLMEKGGVV